MNRSAPARRRAWPLLLITLLSVVAVRGTLYAHAMLLSASPAANSVLSAAPTQIRLVFSEPVDASVSGISILEANAPTKGLVVSADPRDVAALIAPVAGLGSGEYRVTWRTVSADGHRIDGSFTFTIHASAVVNPTEQPPPPAPLATRESMLAGPSLFGAPLLAALLRGAAVGFIMAFAGLLFFAWRSPHAAKATQSAVGIGSAAAICLACHILAWSTNAEPTHRLNPSWVSLMLDTAPGHMELWRLAAVGLSLWALVIARRVEVAAIFAAIAVAVSGAIGHSVAMHSVWAVPAKIAHLGAGAAWLGGLLWLVRSNWSEAGVFAREARRVSMVALIAVIVVAVSGLAQTALFLDSPSDLVDTAYGRVVLIKVAGILVLIALGAFHRYKVLPNLDGPESESRLRSSVRREIGVFAIVTLVAGLLAYISPHAT